MMNEEINELKEYIRVIESQLSGFDFDEYKTSIFKQRNQAKILREGFQEITNFLRREFGFNYITANKLVMCISKLNGEKALKDFKIWCTKCDLELENKGIALDCPEDGIFYICPSCDYKIAVFEKESE